MNWDRAKGYCAELDNHEGQLTNWRLPTIEELKTLVIEEQHPAIDTTFFPDTPSDNFWTIDFKNGEEESKAGNDMGRFRCVHAKSALFVLE